VDAIPRAYSGLAAGRCNFYSFPEKYGFPEKSERRIGEIAGSSPAITGRPTGTALVVIVLRYPRKEDSTMKRRLALVAVLGGALLAFGVQNAAAKRTCTYKGTDYSEGSASCQTGQQFRCADGEWKGLGVACSDNPAAAASTCQFGGMTFPNGTSSCQGGNQFVCANGTWSATNTVCPAADSPVTVLPRGRGCIFNDMPVNHNSAICKGGTTYLCSDGEWVILGTKCR